LLSTLAAGPVIIVTSERTLEDEPARARALAGAGARLLPQSAGDFQTALRALHACGVTSLVLEGGAALHRAALDAGVVDAVHIYISPAPVGPMGVDWVGGGRLAWETLNDRRALWLGADMLVEGRVSHVHGID